MRINHNISAMNTYRQYNVNTRNASKSMEKLSSGYRINRAADDAAGLSISEKMRSQIRGLSQATRNAEDGISFIQTAEGALNEVSDMLVRLKELAVQVQNGTYSDNDKANIGAEMKALGKAISDIFVNTKFNGIEVFGTQELASPEAMTGDEVAEALSQLGNDGDFIRFQNGAWEVADAADFDKDSEDADKGLQFSAVQSNIGRNVAVEGKIYKIVGDKIHEVDLENLDSNDLPTVGNAVAFDDVDGATIDALVGKDGSQQAAKIVYGEDANQDVVIYAAKTQKLADLTALTAAATTANGAMAVTVTAVEAAIDEVNTIRAGYGAIQNQLEHASNNLATTKENLQSAESRIRDVDMAEEMMEYTKNNILIQAAQAMLAQANTQPQGILQLLQ